MRLEGLPLTPSRAKPKNAFTPREIAAPWPYRDPCSQGDALRKASLVTTHATYSPPIADRPGAAVGGRVRGELAVELAEQ
jgi:hypothetical protein